MTKKRKITLGVIAAVIVAAVAGTLLGVFIPPLLNRQKIDELVKNQVKPEEGKGNFLKYDTKPALTTQDFQNLPYADKLTTIESFAKNALKRETNGTYAAKQLVSNYVVSFWKNFKNSAAYTERFEKWEKDINKAFDDEVKNYKQMYGSNWEYNFQVKVLDPVGGNVDDWKRAKLFDKANSAFDEYLFENIYINGLREDGTDVLPSLSQGNISTNLQEYLTSPGFVNGSAPGQRNKVVFQPSNNEKTLNPVASALAKFQEFVFMDYVKTELPLITSMTLWKHVDPTTINVDGHQYFNTKKAEMIYNGTFASPIDDTTSGDTSTTPSSGVGISMSYKWQAFPAKGALVDSPTGSISYNSTDKYLEFVKKYNSNNKFVDTNTGLINIPVTYTDDSSTLYFIKLAGGDKSVFSTSYTQYAAGATYKFNELLGVNDANVPTTNALSDQPIVAGTSGTEIMSNFMKTSPATGFFALPNSVKAIINDDNQFYFKGLYNGIQAVADTVNIPGTPYILTRNESGVHIIGVDRFDKIKAATTYDGKINEIANTLLWRYFATQNGLNAPNYLNNGFTNFDLKAEIKTYFTTHRDEILYKYIIANETTAPADQNDYLFGDNNFTNVSDVPKLSENIMNNFIQSWFAYIDYKNNLAHKDLVKNKILGVQTTNALTDKTFGNSVIQNGIASIQPYTRNTTVDQDITRTNKGYVDQTFGTYDSLNIFENLETAKPYKETVLKTKLDTTETEANNLYTQLGSFNGTNYQIGFKKLTYQSAKYNQYLQVGYPDIDRMVQNGYKQSTMYYVDNMDILNNSIANFISVDGPLLKTMIDTQRSIADLQYNPATDGTTRNTKAASSSTNTLDVNNLALTGSYSNPTTMNNAPAIPNSPTAANKDYVNYYLQKSYDLIEKLPMASDDFGKHLNDNVDALFKLGRNKWAINSFKNPYDDKVLSFIKEVMGIKYAFDFNDETGLYEFTKFRDHLLQETSNYKKAAFVWVSRERNDLIKDYNTKTTQDHFTLKQYPIAKGIDVNGYAYQGAPTVDEFKQDGYFKPTVTFNDSTNYFRSVPLAPNGPSYLGFQGMVFQSNLGTFTDLGSANPFIDDIHVFTNANTTVATKNDLKAQGSMYNIGSRQKLAEEVENGIYTWDAVIKTSTWLNSEFDVNVDNVSQANLAQAKTELKNLILNETTKIPESLFTRNKGVVLASGTSIFNDELPLYFGATDTKGGLLNQVVITQFNHDDVVKLFDTNGDNQIDDNDKGINWAVANSAEGFLGSSAEAFFISAMQWYLSQPSFSTTAYKNSTERQGKFEAFDRRLNDLFGKALLSNWKETL